MIPISALHIVPKLSVSGGVANQLIALLLSYNRARVTPAVICLGAETSISDEIRGMGIDVTSLDHVFTRGFSLPLVLSLRRHIRELHPDVVRTHEYRASLHGRIAAILARTPCIIASVHNIYKSPQSGYQQELKPNRRALNFMLGRLTDRVVTVSEAVRRDVLAYDGLNSKRTVVIHNGIETLRFAGRATAAIASEFGLAGRHPVLCSVGRLVEQKGQTYLLDAVAMLKDRFPSVMLLVVGDGPLDAALKEKARTLGIVDNVIFAGVRRDVPAIIAASDIFVFPSLWEGFGNALIEGMAAGKPVVASDIPTVREIAGNSGAAIIVPPCEPRPIADAIGRIASDKALAKHMSKASIDLAGRDFTIAGTAGKYTDLYHEVLAAKGINLG